MRPHSNQSCASKNRPTQVHHRFDAVQATPLAICFDHVNRPMSRPSRARPTASRARTRRRAIRTRRRTRHTRSRPCAAPEDRRAASFPALRRAHLGHDASELVAHREHPFARHPHHGKTVFDPTQRGQARGIHSVFAEIPGRHQDHIRAETSIVACEGRKMQVLADRQPCENRSDALDVNVRPG